jgi:FAD/FMN-containing dehydrogenase
MADLSALAARTSGALLLPDADGYAAACTGFNLAVVPRPDAVLRVADAGDVVAAVRFARENGMPVRVIVTGHGAHGTADGGLLLNLAALDEVRIDPHAQTATFGGGTRVGAIVAAAAEHGLAPIGGSSTNVGAVGFLLGGGLGPLSRRYGFGSDRLVSLRVVTGTGELVTASADESPELLWALRGGKGGLGVVVEATVSLVPMPELYGGALTFDASDAEALLGGWLRWAADADPAITTSAALQRFPDVELLPPFLRGRDLVSIRVAAPVDAGTGDRLVAPLRALGTAEADTLAAMSPAAVATIHNDPTEPGAGWSRGFQLRGADDAFVRALLAAAGPASGTPFLGVEIRQLGGAIAVDVPEGSAIGGRENPYALNVVGLPVPDLFARALPDAFAGLRAALADWIAPTTTINWLGDVDDPEQFRSAWSPEAFARLAAIRAEFDPDGVFPFGATA